VTEAAPRPPSTNRVLVRSTATIAGLTLLFSAVSLLREQAIAAWFGSGPSAEAFVMAYALPGFVINTAAGIIAPVFTPMLLAARHRDGTVAAQAFAGATFTATVAVGLAVSVLLAVAGPVVMPYFAAGFDASRQALAVQLMYLLVPAVALSNVSYLWTALLNADHRFVAGGLAPSLQPLGALLGLVVAGHRFGIHAMAAGLTLGAVAQLVLLGVAVRRAGHRVRFDDPRTTPGMPALASQYGALFLGSVLMGSTLLITQSMATRISPGALAHLNFASVAVLFAVGLGSRTVGQVLLPHFSAYAATGAWDALEREARRALRWTWALTVPATLVLIAVSGIAVRLLFERGAFTAADTAVVTTVQRVLALQVPWYIANIVAVRLVSSLQMNQVLLWVAAMDVVLTVVSNLLLAPLLGLEGIALSSAIVYAFNFSLCWWLAIRRIRGSRVEGA
jgi:putative peptidoglycan lipid II flippase